MSHPSIDATTRRHLFRLLDKGWANRKIARKLGLSPTTVANYRLAREQTVVPPLPAAPAAAPPRLPDPIAGGPDTPALPDPFRQSYEPFRLADPGRYLVLSDVHLPYHDRRAVEKAVAEGVKAGVAGVLLNGDTFDFYAISRYQKEPNKPRLRDELLMGREFLRWLRSQFPAARIVFKEGNHDERFRWYLADRAPEVFDLDDLHLPNVVRAGEQGVEWVGDKRVIRLGKLPVVHGHEFAGGGGVSPARWLYLRAGSSALCGHFHQTSEYGFRTLDGRPQRVWSAGCLSYLHPQYRPANQWNHGYALVELAADGTFQVTNRAVL